MDERQSDEARGFVCCLGVLFVVLGLVIILVLPFAIPLLSENGVNQHGWWLVAFGAIGIAISAGGALRPPRRQPRRAG
ncbi:MAG: hypothetical protein JW839_10395 [Candidatus Lokiarchaeota archaeon]|nr:hypothetical protein [Candidatus Lokiarchaeota archaeon]